MNSISSNRIAVGMIRLAIVLMVGTTAVICWHQAGAPYAQLQNQLFALNLSTDASWSGDLGTPVYYGFDGQPQQLQVNMGQMGFALVAEPKIKNDETVNCLRKFPNASVRVVDHAPSGLGSLLSPNTLPEHFVLFDRESTADAVVVASSPPTLDFQAIHPDARLDSCLFEASVKATNQTKNSVSNAKREFYLGSASLLAKALLSELVLFLLLYWVLRGFFVGGRPA